ncbi:MAG: hypothetical protein U1E46_00275 [Hyphomicrobiales bacterium]
MLLEDQPALELGIRPEQVQLQLAVDIDISTPKKDQVLDGPSQVVVAPAQVFGSSIVG